MKHAIFVSIEFELDGYFSVDTKTLTSAGGTRLFIHNSLKNDVKVRNDLSLQLENAFESTFVEISQKKRKNIVCGCVYKHPSFSPASFSAEFLDNVLPKIESENKLVTIMGDFNINLLDYDTHIGASNFYDTIACHNLQPLILQPSRVTSRSQTLIDNIFSNNCKYNTVSGNIICTISDHFAQFAIFTDYSLKMKRNTIRSVYGRSFTYFNDSEFVEELAHINWNYQFGDEKNPDTLVNILIDKVTDIINVMAPVKKLTKKSYYSNKSHG